jgi:hydrogenase expression/formation protein HypC
MCLAVPMQVISKDSEAGGGVAEIGGVKRNVSFMMLPEANIGDYVIVHAGFEIQLLNDEEAQKRLELFREIADSASD